MDSLSQKKTTTPTKGRDILAGKTGTPVTTKSPNYFQRIGGEVSQNIKENLESAKKVSKGELSYPEYYIKTLALQGRNIFSPITQAIGMGVEKASQAVSTPQALQGKGIAGKVGQFAESAVKKTQPIVQSQPAKAVSSAYSGLSPRAKEALGYSLEVASYIPIGGVAGATARGVTTGAERAGGKAIDIFKQAEKKLSPAYQPTKITQDVIKKATETATEDAKIKLANDYREIGGSLVKPRKLMTKAESKNRDLPMILAERPEYKPEVKFNGTVQSLKQADKLNADIDPLNEHLDEALTLWQQGKPQISLNSVRATAKKLVDSDEWLIDSGDASKIKKELDNAFDAYIDNYGEYIDITRLNKIKRARWKKANFEKDLVFADTDRIIGRTGKKMIDGLTKEDLPVNELNDYIGQLYEAEKFLRSLDGRKVKGGKLGGYFGRTLGTAIGSQLGFGALGALGGMFGGDLVTKIMMDRTFSAPIKSLLFKNLSVKDPQALAQVMDYINRTELEQATRLRLPATKGIMLPAPKDTSGVIRAEAPGQRVLPKEQLMLPPAGGTTRPPIALPSPGVLKGQQNLRQGGSQAMYGAAGGLEIDDEGNIKFNPGKAALGVLGMKGIEEAKGALGKTIMKKGGMIEKPKTILPALRSADQLVEKKPIINLKRDVPATDIYGKKSIIPTGEALTPYELKGNKFLLKDGEEYIVNKNQYQNIKGQSIKAEAKEFAPELKQTTETVKGKSLSPQNELTDAELSELNRLANIRRTPQQEERYLELGRRNDEGHRELYGEDATKFSQYTLPGGENYKEILIQAPVKYKNIGDIDKDYIFRRQSKNSSFFDVIERKTDKKVDTISVFEGQDLAENFMKTKGGDFKSAHWDERNVLAHLRMNWRKFKQKSVAFMEELQSDWAREARSSATPVDKLPEGYRIETKPTGVGGYSQIVVNDAGDVIGTGNSFAEARDSALKYLNRDVKPQRPLLKNWQELATKRALKEAVDSNADYFAWTTGEQQAARYNLSKQVENIKWEPLKGKETGRYIQINPKNVNQEGFIGLNVNDKGIVTNTTSPHATTWIGKKLDEVVGKGIAEKIGKDGFGELSGEGLNIGGEWAKNLYDRQVKSIVEDLTGGKVETLDMGLPIEKREVEQWSVPGPDFGGIKSRYQLDFKDSSISKKPKVGMEIQNNDTKEHYIITDILGDGKFKAVPKESLAFSTDKTGLTEGEKSIILDGRLYGYSPNKSQTFDISTPKSTGQQAIKLTPEIKAKIRGEAPKLKQPSGVSPFATKEVKDQAKLDVMQERVKKPESTGKQIEKKALKDFYETKNPKEALFITSDGKFIDGTGKNQVGKSEWPYMKDRIVDHREVAQEYSKKSGTDALIDYMNKTGNVRMSMQSDGTLNLDVSIMPTEDQFYAIENAYNSGGKKPIIADISGKDGKNIANGEFKNVFEYKLFLQKHKSEL